MTTVEKKHRMIVAALAQSDRFENRLDEALAAINEQCIAAGIKPEVIEQERIRLVRDVYKARENMRFRR